jgi:hypothetical protein
MCRRWGVLALLPAVCLLSPNRSQASSQDELLALVRRGHQSATQMIDTLHCRFEERGPAQEISQKAEYWRTPEAIRYHVRHGPTMDADQTTLVLSAESRVVTIWDSRLPNGQRRTSATISPLTGRLGAGNAWHYALFSFPGDRGAALTLEELLAEPHELRKVKRVTEDGRDLILLEVAHDKWHISQEIWFDPSVNYLVRKRSLTETLSHNAQAKVQRWESVVTHFKEVVPGIYFPERIETRFSRDGRPQTRMSHTFSQIAVNNDLPKELFAVHYPPGVDVVNAIEGKIFKADNLGRLVLQKDKSLGRIAPLPELQASDERQTVTQEEPGSPTRWILPSSLAILALGLGAMAVRKTKRRWV